MFRDLDGLAFTVWIWFFQRTLAMGLHKIWNSVFWILVLLGYTQVGQRGLVKRKELLEKNTTCCFVGYYKGRAKNRARAKDKKREHQGTSHCLSALFSGLAHNIMISVLEDPL
jgi:hypothetical protein